MDSNDDNRWVIVDWGIVTDIQVALSIIRKNYSSYNERPTTKEKLMEEALNELAKHELFKDQFAKMILGATAGFAASKLTEKLYDTLIVARRIKVTA